VKMRRVRAVTILGLLAATAACYEHTFTVGAGAPAGPIVYQEWHSQWLAGLIGERDIQIDDQCPSGNATIHDEQTFLNGLVSVLTTGIYSPTTVTIRCEGGRSGDLELSEGEVMTILGSPRFLERVEELLPDRFGEAELGVRALQQPD